MSDQEALLPLKTAYQDFVELILSLSDDQFPGPMNGWSPRDVLAHLIGWNNLMIEASQSILAGKPPAYYADAPNDYSNINADFTVRFSSQSKRELLEQLKTSMEDFEACLLALPAAELKADHGVRHYSGTPATVSRIIASLAGDYQHHTQEIRAWLNKS